MVIRKCYLNKVHVTFRYSFDSGINGYGPISLLFYSIVIINLCSGFVKLFNLHIQVIKIEQECRQERISPCSDGNRTLLLWRPNESELRASLVWGRAGAQLAQRQQCFPNHHPGGWSWTIRREGQKEHYVLLLWVLAFKNYWFRWGGHWVEGDNEGEKGNICNTLKNKVFF